MVLCLGDFFGPQPAGPTDDDALPDESDLAQLLAGKLKVPLPLFIMRGEHALPRKVSEKIRSSGGELCSNVTLLGNSSVTTTAKGLRIAILGGKYDANVFKSAEDEAAEQFITAGSLQSLLSHPTLAAPESNPQTLAAAKVAAPDFRGVDILLTSLWPISITQHSSNAPPLTDYVGNTAPPLDEVVRRARPRYYFAAGGTPSRFWEREPFVWEDESPVRATRFISLGSFGEQLAVNEKKPRWFYAFSMAPLSSSQAAPAKFTKNPFTTPLAPSAKRPIEMAEAENFIWGSVAAPSKRARTESQLGSKRPREGYRCKICASADHFVQDCPDKPEKRSVPEGYVCRVCQGTDHVIRDCPKNNETGDTGGKKPPPGYNCRACGSELHLIKDCFIASQEGRARQRDNRHRGPPKEIAPDECWFCLSNPRVAKHLIVSIGSECYLTLPKGQIPPTEPDSAVRSPVPGGGHMLIVPISHYPTLASVPEDLAVPIVTEIEQYKSSLRRLYEAHGAVPVVFEISRLTGKGGHAHIQVVPVPAALASKVEATFRQEGESAGIAFEDNPDEALESVRSTQQNYFRVDLPDGRKMLHVLHPNSPFHLQFGRAVLAIFLGVADRVDWKACAQAEKEERRDAQLFKTAFASFDPMRT